MQRGTVGPEPYGGQGVWTSTGKSQVAIGFLRNSDMDHP